MHAPADPAPTPATRVHSDRGPPTDARPRRAFPAHEQKDQCMSADAASIAGSGPSTDFGGPILRDPQRPMHEQLQQRLRDAIERGVLTPGDALPGEHVLCQIFGVSRTVVRQALGELEHDEVVARHKGKGTFVRPPKRREALAGRLTGLYQEVAAQGGSVESTILRHEHVPAPAAVAQGLGLELGTEVVLLERLREVNGERWSLSTTYLPVRIGRLIEGADLEHGSLYEVLDSHGVRPAAGERTVEAVIPDGRERGLLGLAPEAPALRLTSATFDASGEPLEFFSALHRGDRSRFVFQMDPMTEAGRLIHVE